MILKLKEKCVNKNVINVYGETGSGKTSFIKELNLNNTTTKINQNTL